MKRGSGNDGVNSTEKLDILCQRQPPHQHRAGENLLVRRLGGQLRK